MEEREEAQGGFVVAGADTTKVFELIEHALDQISLLIEVLVIAPRSEPMSPWWNHRLGPLLLDCFHNVIGVITLVGDDDLGRQPFEQGQSRVIVGTKARREDKAQGIAVAVARRVNLRAQAAPTAA